MMDENEKAVAGVLPKDFREGMISVDHSRVVSFDSKQAGASIKLDGKGNPRKTANNIALKILADPNWRGCLGLNTLAQKIEWLKSPPLIPGLVRSSAGDPFRDEDLSYITGELSEPFNTDLNEAIVLKGVAQAARVFEFNPLQEWIKSCEWDGKARLSSWLARYLGVENSVYAATAGRWWLISAIARAMDPGCQVDHMLVFEGDEGVGKTSAARALGGKWHLEKLPNLRDYTRAIETMTGKWIVSIGELDALRGAAETQTKDFLTLREDTIRRPWAKMPIDIPRSQVFLGTTNESQYVHAGGDARRFWPVKVGHVSIADLEADRDQLIGEAYRAYKDKERFWPSDAVERAMFNEARDGRRSTDVWEDRILEWLHGRGDVRARDVLEKCLDIEPSRQGRVEQMRVTAILRRAGYDLVTRGHDRVRVWCPPPAEQYDPPPAYTEPEEEPF